MAQLTGKTDRISEFDAVFDHNHVLLVAAVAVKPTAVDCAFTVLYVISTVLNISSH